MQQQIPPIKIISKGETYFINRATNTTNQTESLNEDQECSAIHEIEMETSKNNEENKINNELTHQDES